MNDFSAQVIADYLAAIWRLICKNFKTLFDANLGLLVFPICLVAIIISTFLDILCMIGHGLFAYFHFKDMNPDKRDEMIHNNRIISEYMHKYNLDDQGFFLAQLAGEVEVKTSETNGLKVLIDHRAENGGEEMAVPSWKLAEALMLGSDKYQERVNKRKKEEEERKKLKESEEVFEGAKGYLHTDLSDVIYQEFTPSDVLVEADRVGEEYSALEVAEIAFLNSLMDGRVKWTNSKKQNDKLKEAYKFLIIALMKADFELVGVEVTNKFMQVSDEKLIDMVKEYDDEHCYLTQHITFGNEINEALKTVFGDSINISRRKKDITSCIVIRNGELNSFTEMLRNKLHAEQLKIHLTTFGDICNNISKK